MIQAVLVAAVIDVPGAGVAGVAAAADVVVVVAAVVTADIKT